MNLEPIDEAAAGGGNDEENSSRDPSSSTPRRSVGFAGTVKFADGTGSDPPPPVESKYIRSETALQTQVQELMRERDLARASLAEEGRNSARLEAKLDQATAQLSKRAAKADPATAAEEPVNGAPALLELKARLDEATDEKDRMRRQMTDAVKLVPDLKQQVSTAMDENEMLREQVTALLAEVEEAAMLGRQMVAASPRHTDVQSLKSRLDEEVGHAHLPSPSPSPSSSSSSSCSSCSSSCSSSSSTTCWSLYSGRSCPLGPVHM